MISGITRSGTKVVWRPFCMSTNNFLGKRGCSTSVSIDELSIKLEDLKNRMFKMESSGSGDFYKYSFAMFGAGVTALFGAGYINKRIDDTKVELKEKIGDLENHLEKRIDLMERHILEKLNVSDRVSKLEDK